MSTAMLWQTLSTSSGDTEKLGQLLGKRLNGGEVIELRSDLGGGKTTFIRGLVKGAGSLDNVVSPTFTLSRIYHTKKFDVSHFDFYRLDDPGILADQLAESVNAPKTVVAVEWAGIVEDVLPAERLSIELKPTAGDSEEREVTISYPESYGGLIKKLETDWQEVRP